MNLEDLRKTVLAAGTAVASVLAVNVADFSEAEAGLITLTGNTIDDTNPGGNVTLQIDLGITTGGTDLVLANGNSLYLGDISGVRITRGGAEILEVLAPAFQNTITGAQGAAHFLNFDYDSGNSDASLNFRDNDPASALDGVDIDVSDNALYARFVFAVNDGLFDNQSHAIDVDGFDLFNAVFDAAAFDADGVFQLDDDDLAVPEPGTLALFTLGLAGIATTRRRHRR